jgi:hypothetical protein
MLVRIYNGNVLPCNSLISNVMHICMPINWELPGIVLKVVW